jgi:hypothetical protein
MMNTMRKYGDDEDRSIEREREQAVSVLRSELIRHVLNLPDETRAKLLAFLHLVQDLRLVEGDLQVERSGDVRMTLFRLEKPRAKSRRAPDNAAEPLQSARAPAGS